MDFFGDLSGLIPALIATAKAAGPALAVGALLKHGDKVKGLGRLTRLVPNGLIPLVLPVVATGITGDAATGLAAGMGATWSQQILKMGVRFLAEKMAPDGSSLQTAIGPGSRLSI